MTEAERKLREVEAELRELHGQKDRTNLSQFGYQRLIRLWLEHGLALLNAREADGRRIAELEAERDAERLRYGQQRARNAVFMSAMASLARTDEKWQAKAQAWVDAADAAANFVRLDDFVTAKVGKPL